MMNSIDFQFSPTNFWPNDDQFRSFLSHLQPFPSISEKISAVSDTFQVPVSKFWLFQGNFQSISDIRITLSRFKPTRNSISTLFESNWINKTNKISSNQFEFAPSSKWLNFLIELNWKNQLNKKKWMNHFQSIQTNLAFNQTESSIHKTDQSGFNQFEFTSSFGPSPPPPPPPRGGG